MVINIIIELELRNHYNEATDWELHSHELI